MEVIKNRLDLELWADKMLYNFYKLPTNFKMIIELKSEDFDKLIEEVQPQPIEQFRGLSDFNYVTAIGVLFNVRRV